MAPWAPVPKNELGDPMVNTNELGDPLPPVAQDYAPPAPTAGQQQISNDQSELQKVRWNQSHPWGTAPTYDAAGTMTDPGNHPGKLGKIAHAFSTLGNIAGGIFAPAVTANIPGSGLNMQEKEGGLAKRLNTEIGDESQNQFRGSEQAKNEEETAEMPGKERSEEAAQSAQASLVPSEIAKNDAEVEGLKNPGAKLAANQPLNDVPNLQKALQDRYQILNPGQPLPPQYQLPPNPTQKDYDRVDKALESVEKATGTVAQQQQANALRQQAMAMTRERLDNAEDKASKPTADEQRRSDLSENLNENLGTLRDIVTRRPELFGPLAGRWAELKQKFGSDDPDLGTLQTIEHQIGMAQISAHGMRSAQGIQAAADSILNHMHSGPHAVLAAIDAANNSVKTFAGDVERATGKPISPNPEVHHGPTPGTIENGYRFKGGDPGKPESWEKAQ